MCCILPLHGKHSVLSSRSVAALKRERERKREGEIQKLQINLSSQATGQQAVTSEGELQTHSQQI